MSRHPFQRTLTAVQYCAHLNPQELCKLLSRTDLPTGFHAAQAWSISADSWYLQ